MILCFVFFFRLLPLREKEDIKTVLSSSLSPLGEDHRYGEGLCFLECQGSVLLCFLSYHRWWRLIHSTRFCPIAWYRSHTCGPRRTCAWESSPASGLLRALWREQRFRGDQPEDDSGEWTSKATNLELYETSQFSNAFALVFCIAQAKWNTSAGQIQSMGSQCAASDGWALLFAFRVSSFILSLKDLFQQLLNEHLWWVWKYSVPRKSIRGEEGLLTPVLEGLLLQRGAQVWRRELF